jgi:hypothetical protein
MTDTSLPLDPADSAPRFDTPEPLLTVIADRPMPDFDQKSRSAYPFDDMQVGTCFLAGKASKALKGRLYSAIHARKKKHPAEQYKFELMDNGDLYVWNVAA